jgi:23S rRNA pseudouridine2457 synthase
VEMPASSRNGRRLILFNKPYRVLCKFTDAEGRPTLADFISVPDVYPAGRLDFDSEGLVLLTNVGSVQTWISHPRYKLPKTYWVQVEGIPDEDALRRLATGVPLREGLAEPAQVRLMEPPAVWPRTPPIRERKQIPTSWMALTIVEGRNRQVRRMSAAVGYPTLRLIRQAVGPWELGSLQPGQWRLVPCPRSRQEILEMMKA